MSEELDELTNMVEAVEAGKSERDKALGRKAELIAQLKREFKISSSAAVIKLKRKLLKQLEEQKDILKDKMDSLRRDYEWD